MLPSETQAPVLAPALAIAIAGALAALLAGCGRERSGLGAARADSAAGAVPVDPATVPGAALIELWQLREGVSLAEWMAARLDERLERRDSAAGHDFAGDWCARAEKRITTAGHTLVRSAFFYPPEPPAPPEPAELPADTSTEQLVARGCTLGMVWVAGAVGDTLVAAALADSVRAGLSRAFGAALADTSLNFWGSAFWTHRARFRRGAVTAASALNTMPSAEPADSGRRRREVLAFALLPASGLSVDSAPVADHQGWTPDTLPLAEAIATAALDSAAAAPLTRVLAAAAAWRYRAGPGGGMMDPDTLAAALRRWLGAAAALPPARRAAALFVADETLDRASCAFMTCGRASADDTSRLRPLIALGARFNYSPLGASWVYTRNWLLEARALGRDSQVGRAILLVQLAHAFDFSGTCAEGAEGFRRVIADGERYLERVPASPVAAEVRFLVAEAYRDIVALARGALPDYADSAAYLAQAPAARARALEHYRAAIAAAPGTPVARAAWRRAWWLLAGLPPRSVRYLCIYD